MSPRARVIAVGQRAAGDDGVGHAVLDFLRRSEMVGIETAHARDTADLAALLIDCERAVIVDAAVGVPAGAVVVLDAEDLASLGRGAPFSHGLSVAEAIRLAMALAPAEISPRVHVVAVGITPPDRWGEGLSTMISAAVPRAARRVGELVARSDSRNA